jgi:subtilisin family serine protease
MLTPADRIRSVIALVALAAATPAVAPSISAQRRFPRGTIAIGGREAVAGEVLVRFMREVAPAEREAVEQSLDAEETETLGDQPIRRIRSRSFDARALIDFLRTRAGVEYAEPNYIVRAVTTPSDPKFPSLWGLWNSGQTINGSAGTSNADIRAYKAWNTTTGSRANVVTVIDSGIDYTHGDLAPNIWSAPAAFTVTIGGVAIKCAAGTHGFNAITRTCDPRDDLNHGTHVAGTIGAAGNNAAGVTGVNWKASIMGVKFLDASGNGTIADAIASIEFAIQTKKAFASTSGANVRVLSNSWAGGGFSQALLDEINKANANGMLFVAAAGNDGSNNATTPTYPASYKAPNVLAVAASTNQDHLAAFSNYGSNVHLAAPGVDILSTTIGNTYRWMSGTSMATPHVSGAAALVLSRCTLDTAALKAVLLTNAQKVGSLTGWVSTGARLNVYRALTACLGTTTTTTARPSAPAGLIATSPTGTGQVKLSWNAVTNATTYNVKRSYYDGGPYTTVGVGLTSRSYVYNGSIGKRYYFVVSAVNSAGESANSSQVIGLGK